MAKQYNITVSEFDLKAMREISDAIGVAPYSAELYARAGRALGQLARKAEQETPIIPEGCC